MVVLWIISVVLGVVCMVDEISENELRKMLLTHYKAYDFSVNRKLKKTSVLDNPVSGNTVFYSITGSPPKGYVIYIPGKNRVNFYDVRGKRFRILKDTIVKEVDSGKR